MSLQTVNLITDRRDSRVAYGSYRYDGLDPGRAEGIRPVDGSVDGDERGDVS